MTHTDGDGEAPLVVYVVDDDADVRDALGLLLRLHGYEVCAFDAAAPFLAAVHARSYGCLVTDIRMPGMSGLELQRELGARDLRIPVVILTAHGDVESARVALKAEAVDFLLKPFRERDLLVAIRSAFEREGLRLQADRQALADERSLATLTLREREVAALLATGAQNVDIAAHLGISPRTVEVHKARCMEKLQARSIADIVRLADRTGLTPPPALRR